MKRGAIANPWGEARNFPVLVPNWDRGWNRFWMGEGTDTFVVLTAYGRVGYGLSQVVGA